MFSPRLAMTIALALAFGAGANGLVDASASTASGTTTRAAPTSTHLGHRGAHGGASNAQSGPAAGGSVGKVSAVSKSGFELSTVAGEKVTIKVTPATTYRKGVDTTSVGAVVKGKTALVFGVSNGTTITAAQVILEPPNGRSTSSAEVVPFRRGVPSTSKQVGEIPASYRQGSGTIVSGPRANEATKAALRTYPGGIVDRVVKIGTSEYEVHNIGVNWPHHIFVNRNFKVVGAD
jgi:hypothetical protein